MNIIGYDIYVTDLVSFSNFIYTRQSFTMIRLSCCSSMQSSIHNQFK